MSFCLELVWEKASARALSFRHFVPLLLPLVFNGCLFRVLCANAQFLNYSDMVVASPTATFGLPEALRGIYAGAGGLPRLLRNTSLPLANEIALTARFLSAQEALNFQLINKVSKSQESVVDEAVALAQKVADISPDAIIVSRAAIREAWERDSVETAFVTADARWRDGLMSGENTKEGLLAFKEKRQPKWKPSKL